MARLPGAAERAVPAHPRGSGRRGPARRTRTLVVEKPFGTDLADAKALNALIARSFDEHDVFRIDHFLAKQTVLDILGLRFANRIFEPVWNSNHISRVDITWYESLGLEGRASYYDRAGALRDMIQNHLLQMLALVAMEPPRSITERDLRDRKVEVAAGGRSRRSPRRWRRRPAEPATARAPSAGKELPAYADEEGVDPARGTETYAEVTFRDLELALGGHAVPAAHRQGDRQGAAGDRRALQVRAARALRRPGPPERAALPPLPRRDLPAAQPQRRGRPLRPGAGQRSTREFPTQDLPPYSLLLKEILEGDPTLSIRGDEAEELWRIVEPVLQAWADDEVPLEEYRAGSAAARPGRTRAV